MPTKNIALWDGTLPSVGPVGPQGPPGTPRAPDLGWSGVFLQSPGFWSYGGAWVRWVSANNGIILIGRATTVNPMPPNTGQLFVTLPVEYKTYYNAVQAQPCRAWTSGGIPVTATVQISLGTNVYLVNSSQYDLVEYRLSTGTFARYDIYV